MPSFFRPCGFGSPDVEEEAVQVHIVERRFRPSGHATAGTRQRIGGPSARVMSAPVLAGVVAGYGIAVPVGAIGVLIVGLSARASASRAIRVP